MPKEVTMPIRVSRRNKKRMARVAGESRRRRNLLREKIVMLEVKTRRMISRN